MRRSFKASFENFGVVVQQRGTSLFHMLAQELKTDVQVHNPVDSGFTRASWKLTINKPETGVFNYRTGRFTRTNVSRKLRPPSGAQIPIPNVPKIGSIKIGDRIHLTNNVDYIKFIEERVLFVKAAMQRLRRHMIKIAKELNK